MRFIRCCIRNRTHAIALTPVALLCAGLVSCAPLDTRLQVASAPAANLQALERACLRDPLDARAWQALGEALSTGGQDRRAQQMFRQAVVLRQHDLRADFDAVGGRTGVVALDQALAAPDLAPLPAPATDGWAQSHIHVGIDGMLELRRTPALHATAPLAHARLEISNGNGITGMARALSRRIDEPGVQVTRLSNQPGFAVRHTRIEYEATHIDAARRLALRLGTAQLKEVGSGAPANLRLVLGRDLTRQGALFKVPARPASGLGQASVPVLAGRVS